MIVLSGLVSCLRVSLLSGFCVRCVWPVFFFFSYVRLFKVNHGLYILYIGIYYYERV